MYLQKLTIVPFLPFQQDDLKSILRSRIQYINTKYEGLNWKRLHLSNTALDYFLSTEHVEYFDLFGKDNDDPSSILTFSLRGAKALEGNALVKALHTKLINGTRRQPYKVAVVDVSALGDNYSIREAVFSWCADDESGALEECEEEWRLMLS
jgi:hypothetical protein